VSGNGGQLSAPFVKFGWLEESGLRGLPGTSRALNLLFGANTP
jgi:hypothetical protein